MSVWRSTLRARVKPLVYRFRSRLLYRAAMFYVNTVDNDNDSDYFTNGEAAFIRAHLRGAKLAFDVGAAKGEWTEIALSADPHVVVHCFEPTTSRFEILLRRDFGARVILNRLGLGESQGQAEIFWNTLGGSNSLFPPRHVRDTRSGDSETITISTIDRYCQERGIEEIDFVKMDIEGYELAALRGAAKMLREGRIGIVQFEYSQAFLDAGTTLQQVMNVVREINPVYEFHKILPDGTRLVPEYDHELENFKTQNWAIIRR